MSRGVHHSCSWGTFRLSIQKHFLLVISEYRILEWLVLWRFSILHYAIFFWLLLNNSWSFNVFAWGLQCAYVTTPLDDCKFLLHIMTIEVYLGKFFLFHSSGYGVSNLVQILAVTIFLVIGEFLILRVHYISHFFLVILRVPLSILDFLLIVGQGLLLLLLFLLLIDDWGYRSSTIVLRFLLLLFRHFANWRQLFLRNFGNGWFFRW